MTLPAEPRRGTRAFQVGSALIVASFAVYPTYPLIALLPMPVKTLVLGEIAAWIVSWTLFCVGTALAGKDAVGYLKQLFARRAAPRPK